MTEWSHIRIWAAIAGIGICTYVIRLSFVYLFGRIDSVPPRVEQTLRYVPAAVLAALVVPAVVTVQPTLGETVLDARLVAGSIATTVAWRTENVFYTIVVGMATLWVIRFGPSLIG
ncbi:AzlD domain-containing protein [Natrinema halophilum]|uniref:AzlD domain-containing protein n=1 Tax=Natrinema halophilum TaxID=1699371 RepID=A0A7D5KEZ7_9EURY|nr:AzlD domain-containing protein [Natrinema halophilum]QLG50676.1 AzlD domain-containing protein [Natrinema halophilum]